MPKRPFMSVAVISHNGEATLGATLDSLRRQTYPRNRYEIIVIDDASADHTAAVAKSYADVRYVGLQVNRGVSGARNAGLEAAKGDIYVCFDDDCIAEPTWLAHIAKGYAKGNPAGVGGRLTEPQPVRGITNRYISACDSNIGVQLAGPNSGSKNPLHRLWRYIQSQAQRSKPSAIKSTRVAVTELYGANGSFPREVLNRVGGWQESMSGIEDRDISRRIHDALPRRKFYSVPKAVIVHERGQTLLQYLLRPYKRGPVNLAFHRKYHITPPVFPFPFLFVFACASVAILYPLLLPAVAVAVPQILYYWWTLKALRRRDISLLLFPYIQLAEESMIITGLIRGYILLLCARAAHAIRAVAGILHLAGTLGLIAGWVGIMLCTRPAWLHAVVSVPFLLLMPGYCAWLLATAKRKEPSYGFRTLGYVTGLSLLILMLSGLVLNEAYVVLGMTQPFTVTPLTYTIGATCVLLALLAFARSPRSYRLVSGYAVTLKGSVASGSAAIAIGLLLPALAAAGAVTLNNGGPDGLAMLAMGAIAALVLVMIFRHTQLSRYYGWFLYSICLSILLATSMRGWNITGHDVMQEYQVFRLTLTHAAWHMNYYQDAYMACLSITILPTIFQKLTGISDPYVFKFIFQLFFALLAPVMYEMLRGYVSKRTALLATFLLLSFPTFLTDIMMLNRQETALLFLALSLLAGLDKQLDWRLKSILGFLFLVGMVLSHYSTSYVALGALLFSLALAAAWRWAPVLLRRRPGSTMGQLTSIYHVPVVIGALFVLIAWGSIATQTSNNIYSTLRSVTATAGNRSLSAANLTRPMPGSTPTARYAAAATSARSLPAKDYYAPSVIARYPLENSPEIIAPVNRPITQITSPAVTVTAVYNALRTVYGLAIEGFVALGLLLAFVLRKNRAQMPLQFLFVGVGALVLIGMQVVLPSAINYSVTRMIQEALLVLSLPMVLAGIWLLQLVRIPERAGEAILGVVLVGFYTVLSGLLPALTGGFKPVLPLSNTGFYYEAYYTHEEEITAARWLDTNTPVGSRVYSDEFMRRKLITYAGIFAQPMLVPGAIPQDSLVFLSYGNSAFHQVAVYNGSALIYYQPPVGFLDANKNLVYASTNVAIYK